MLIQLWMFGRHFLKNKLSKSVNIKRNYLSPKIKFEIIKQKFKLYKNCIHYYEPGSLQILKHFSDEISGYVNKCDF